VFVADSQRAMKEANIESVNNLRSNLAEIGIKLDDLPLVFQYNKRDLSNILAVDELEESLNAERKYESYEACAVLGQGVFETLKAISRLTLRSLKKRMLGDDRGARLSAATIPPEPAAPPPPRPVELRDLSVAHVQPPPRPVELDLEPELEPIPFDSPAPPPPPTLLGVEAFDADDVETVNEFEDALNSLDAPLPELDLPEPLEMGEVSFAEAPAPPEPAPVAEPPVKHVRVRSNIDILAELEKLRKSTTAETNSDRAARRPTTGISIDDLLASSLNHRKEINRIFEVQVPHGELAQGRHVTIGLRIEDDEKNPVGEEKTFSIDLHTKQDIEKLLLSLKFHIFGK
jgi:mutual gliding-motility protein MglA